MRDYDFNEVLSRITYLTKRNNITIKELADAISITRAAMSGRAERNSKFKPQEVKLIEKEYKVNLNHVYISTNSLQPITKPKENKEAIGEKLSKIQSELGYLDKAMAKLMEIDEKHYNEIKLGKKKATVDEFQTLASKIDVSLDWLIKD